MYGAGVGSDGLYTAADLPDAITLLGVGSLTKSGTAYGDTTNGVILESGVWARYLSGVRATKACLIDGNGNFTPGDDTVEDQFASSYSVEMSMFYDYVRGSCVVNRTSLETWEGIAYGVGQGSWPPDEFAFEGASVDLKVKLTILCISNIWFIWTLQYEPIAFYCENLNPEAGLTCEEAILISGPGPFLNAVHFKFSENYGQEGQFQSSPNQGDGFYALDKYYDNGIYAGLPLFGSKVS
jgi:hypothetical protein